jgi:uncharacterized membrane protein YGL010W
MLRSLRVPAEDLIVQFARGHRDQRNIATHMVGVPMVVFGCAVLLARGHLGFAASGLSLAWLAWCAATLWAVSRGHLLLGLAVSAGTALLFALAHLASSGPLAQTLGWGLGFVLGGAAIQWLGHCYEGRRSAWLDELHGLLAAPLFVAAEVLFALGLAQGLRHAVERRAGPTVLRDLAHPAA